MRTVDRFDFNDLERDVERLDEVAVVVGWDGGKKVHLGGGKAMV